MSIRQNKERSSKWLLSHHADAILKLGGITGFSSWKAIQPETFALRRLPPLRGYDGTLPVAHHDI